MVLQHADFVSQPLQTLQRLWQFLGVPDLPNATNVDVKSTYVFTVQHLRAGVAVLCEQCLRHVVRRLETYHPKWMTKTQWQRGANDSALSLSAAQRSRLVNAFEVHNRQLEVLLNETLPWS